jgi:hypothetical protein
VVFWKEVFMAKKDAVANEQAQQALAAQVHQQAVDIAHVLPMRLQTLDLDRETVIAPDGKRYVVGTYDDRRIGRGYITAIYPQQNGYLTLVRLPIAEMSSNNPDNAMNRHASVIQAILQGHLNDFLQSARP